MSKDEGMDESWEDELKKPWFMNSATLPHSLSSEGGETSASNVVAKSNGKQLLDPRAKTSSKSHVERQRSKEGS